MTPSPNNHLSAKFDRLLRERRAYIVQQKLDCPCQAESLDQFSRLEALRMVEVLKEKVERIRCGILSRRNSGFAMQGLAPILDSTVTLMDRLEALP